MQPLSMWSLLAHSHSLFSLFFFSLLFFSFFIFTHIFFSLFFIIFFVSLFFSKAEPAPSLVQNEPVVGCSPISPTLGLLCLTTPEAKCVMSVSPSVFRQLEVPSVPLVQFSCTRASHAPHPEHG